MHMNICLITTVLYASLGVNIAEEGWFWHVTDFHWDFSYWTEQLSCNDVDIPSPGPFGDQWCDSPWELVQSSISKLGELKQDVDFILWTGDSLPHVNLSYLSTELNKEIVRNITYLMKQTFPGVKIYATFGNHDYYKKDQFPPHGNEIYNATYLIWEEWINDPTQESNFRKGGYYTIVIHPGVRLLALNSNLYYGKNMETINLRDPADQFAWMESILTAAASNREKVIITGHVPPGYTTPRNIRWMGAYFNERFVGIIRKHASVIAAMHFGHEHHDSFRLFYDSRGRATVSLFLAPSITPWRYQLPNEVEPAHNPGARLVKYDTQNGKQLDILQYYINLNQSNAAGDVTWHFGYKATSLYGIPDLTPVSMATLANKMTSPHTTPFTDYVAWYNTNGSADFHCDWTCFHSMKCGIKHAQDINFQSCLQAINTGNKSTMFDYVWVLYMIEFQLILIISQFLACP